MVYVPTHILGQGFIDCARALAEVDGYVVLKAILANVV
jgi:hypothetical protein